MQKQDHRGRSKEANLSVISKNKTKRICKSISILGNNRGEKGNKILQEFVKSLEEPKPYSKNTPLAKPNPLTINTPRSRLNQNSIPPRRDMKHTATYDKEAIILVDLDKDTSVHNGYKKETKTGKADNEVNQDLTPANIGGDK